MVTVEVEQALKPSQEREIGLRPGDKVTFGDAYLIDGQNPDREDNGNYLGVVINVGRLRGPITIYPLEYSIDQKAFVVRDEGRVLPKELVKSRMGNLSFEKVLSGLRLGYQLDPLQAHKTDPLKLRKLWEIGIRVLAHEDFDIRAA